MISYDTLASKVRWSAAGSFATNAAYANGALYAANGQPFELEALAESDGEKLWTWTPPTGESKFISDVLATSNLVFVSTDGGTYAIDRRPTRRSGMTRCPERCRCRRTASSTSRAPTTSSQSTCIEASRARRAMQVAQLSAG